MSFWIEPRVARTVDGPDDEEQWVIYAHPKDPDKNDRGARFLHRSGAWSESPYTLNRPTGIFATKEAAEALLQSTESHLFEAV